jgi:predicted ATPase
VIKELSLTNFKCFKSLKLEFGNMNVLAGVNGAGKSTVIQSLLAFRQSLQSGSIAKNRIQLRGSLTDLGTAGEVYCAEPGSDWIEIVVIPAEGAPIELRCRQSRDGSTDSTREYFLRLANSIAMDQATGLFAEPFNYLHAERMGPRKVFQIPAEEGHPLCVGKYGENAPYIVASEQRETRISNDLLILESSDGKEYPTIQFQWALWMARLFPGFDGESEIYSKADQVRLGLALQTQQTGQMLFVRPGNTGFGLSFVLGIIVAGLAAKADTMLIVENPEAHLHPKAQSNLGDFLGRVSAGGTQVFLETHSEHVLNGIRRTIKQTILTPEMVRLFFFSKAPDTIEPSMSPISVTASGDFSKWPDDFFDQLDRDLSTILG